MTHIETWTNCVSSVEKMHSFIDGLETRSPFETYTNHISFLWTLSPFLILWIYVNEIFTCTHQKKAVSDELPFWKFVIVFFVFFIHFSRNVTLVLWQSMDILKASCWFFEDFWLAHFFSMKSHFSIDWLLFEGELPEGLVWTSFHW